jgi:cytochrome c peroxidase
LLIRFSNDYLCCMSRMTIRTIACLCLLASLFVMSFRVKPSAEKKAELKVELGRQLFFDKALSHPDGQSCTVCHAPKTAFADPNHAIVSEGMVDGAFVNRNAQSLAYVGFIPPLERDSNGVYRGGLFWDGRSNSLEHQLAGPFFNPAEMNNADTLALVNEVLNAPYYPLYKKLYGKLRYAKEAYQNMCDALAAFERSSLFHEFTSKYDYFLEGKTKLTQQEQQGLELFQGKGRCVTCHSMQPEAESGRILFTDFGYYNLGVPRNEENPFYTTHTSINSEGSAATDFGLGKVVHDENQNGKFRVPTLRNVQYTGPYFHNGYFKTLKEVVHFINVRDAENTYSAEVPSNIAHQITGSLHLSNEEEDALVVFLLCLTDGYALP